MTGATCTLDKTLITTGREFSLVILTSRFEDRRGVFWDGPRNFEPRSDGEDDTWANTPLQTSTPHQREDVWPLRMIQRAAGPIHDGSSVESGSNLDPSGPKAETLPLDHRDPTGREKKIMLFPEAVYFRYSTVRLGILPMSK
ncbi:hypothetical protein AVEN_99181-1 [Araneus ventricosus]|uniref:Uncharacterized protein n=1 Tax=Araneus ventricosus TaxID=182803 RepID=A0A4Y2CI09_ARAVE|nr:hypothetical protein AVEN_99181-1 [Araneus ventricosus]